MNTRWFFLTVAYSGLSPKAPGTIGTLVSLPLGIAILMYFGSQTLFLASLLLTVIAIKNINVYEQESRMHDDKRIVIDELIGMWLALSIAPGITFSYTTILDLNNGILVQIILSFLLFRYFDIKKPSLIGRIDRKVQGGLGVVGDDILAGFAAGISAALIWLSIVYVTQQL